MPPSLGHKTLWCVEVRFAKPTVLYWNGRSAMPSNQRCVTHLSIGANSVQAHCSEPPLAQRLSKLTRIGCCSSMIPSTSSHGNFSSLRTVWNMPLTTKAYWGYGRDVRCFVKPGLSAVLLWCRCSHSSSFGQFGLSNPRERMTLGNFFSSGRVAQNVYTAILS